MAEQAERTRQLELELALVGQTEEARARVLALAQAEQDIRRLGLSGDAAETVRKTELANLALADTLADQTEAWRRVQAAGESAIDGVLDKLKDTRISGKLIELKPDRRSAPARAERGGRRDR